MTEDRLTDALLTWYRTHRRTLPWREDPRPYYVLLSEFMCQQTRIDTVLPYFDRFITRWPTLEDLAAADEDEVLGEWAGLGYYSRARNLLRAAQQAVSDGGLTGDVAKLRALPGVGPYTAGAIASVAFGTNAALVDGNVERVLCRVDGVRTDPRYTPGKRALWERAEELVKDHPSPGDHNQALMELGALVCTPRAPSCTECPWEDMCVAHAEGIEESLPNKPKKAPPVPISGVCVLLERSGRLLMGQRGPGLLAGLWEPVMHTESTDPETLLASLGLQAVSTQSLGSVKHVFSHRRLTLSVHRGVARGEPETGHYAQVRWVDADEVDVALSKLAHKVLALGTTEQVALPLAAAGRVSPEGL